MLRCRDAERERIYHRGLREHRGGGAQGREEKSSEFRVQREGGRKNLDWRGEIKIRIMIKITIEEGEGIDHGFHRGGRRRWRELGMGRDGERRYGEMNMYRQDGQDGEAPRGAN